MVPHTLTGEARGARAQRTEAEDGVQTRPTDGPRNDLLQRWNSLTKVLHVGEVERFIRHVFETDASPSEKTVASESRVVKFARRRQLHKASARDTCFTLCNLQRATPTARGR